MTLTLPLICVDCGDKSEQQLRWQTSKDFLGCLSAPYVYLMHITKLGRSLGMRVHTHTHTHTHTQKKKQRVHTVVFHVQVSGHSVTNQGNWPSKNFMPQLQHELSSCEYVLGSSSISIYVTAITAKGWTFIVRVCSYRLWVLQSHHKQIHSYESNCDLSHEFLAQQPGWYSKLCLMKHIIPEVTFLCAKFHYDQLGVQFR